MLGSADGVTSRSRAVLCRVRVSSNGFLPSGRFQPLCSLVYRCVYSDFCSFSLDGKLFVEFVALIYLSYIQKKMEENGLFATYTLHELLDELDVIECFMEPGKAPIQGEVLKKQEQIYRDLDVTPLLAAGQTADA